jgi:hypothetical protein
VKPKKRTVRSSADLTIDTCFRRRFNCREGLVLHQLSYDGRPVIYRASLVEMAVWSSPDIRLRCGMGTNRSAEIGGDESSPHVTPTS